VNQIGDFAFQNNPLTSITIGSRLSMNDSVFDSGFVQFYQSQGRRAGTYTLRGGQWRLE
jgi:hypothetical protein